MLDVKVLITLKREVDLSTWELLVSIQVRAALEGMLISFEPVKCRITLSVLRMVLNKTNYLKLLTDQIIALSTQHSQS